MPVSKIVQYHEVKLAWICAIQRELDAARATLEEEYALPYISDTLRNASTFVVGRINNHKVVIACLENSRNAGAAARTAGLLQNAFKNLELGFMVGIGGGVTYWGDDIRLGDVVVSKPDGATSGLVAWDSGKHDEEGFQYRGSYSAPAGMLLATANKIDTGRRLKRLNLPQEFQQTMDSINGELNPPIQRPQSEEDRLYYVHGPQTKFNDKDMQRPKVWDVATGKIKDGHVDPQTGLITRDKRETDLPMIHRGIIASGGSVIGNGKKRDAIVLDIYKQLRVKALCFEMEAADLANTIPCLIVRGISDYSDEHKNDGWQDYAALTAAAYTKLLISKFEPERSEYEAREAREAREAAQQRELQVPAANNPRASSSSRSRSQTPESSELLQVANLKMTEAEAQLLPLMSNENGTLEPEDGPLSEKADYTLSPEQMSSYESVFKMWDGEDKGYLTSAHVVQIFRLSGLDDTDLRHVYTASHSDSRDSLSKSEFSVAMHLIYLRVRGEIDPETRPDQFATVAKEIRSVLN